MNPLVTLIFTRNTLPDGWQETIAAQLGGPWRANLFFLDQGIHLINGEWSATLPEGGEKIYCAYGHGQLNGPRPAPGIVPGGLANLGRMIRASDYTLSLPCMHWPAQPGRSVHKKIAILLRDDTTLSLIESSRLAAGMAGCNHKPTLFSAVAPGPIFPMAAAPFIEALHAFGGAIAPTPPSRQLALEQDVIFQL